MALHRIPDFPPAAGGPRGRVHLFFAASNRAISSSTMTSRDLRVGTFAPKLAVANGWLFFGLRTLSWS
jgi:hypothetical protein